MKSLQKSRIIIFVLGLLFIILAFIMAFLSRGTHQSLKSTADATLPQGVHIPININSAGKETLCLLEGIGEKTAEDIIAYREAKGGFENEEDIMNIKGIGEKTFEKIKNYITAE